MIDVLDSDQSVICINTRGLPRPSLKKISYQLNIETANLNKRIQEISYIVLQGRN